MGIEPIRLRCPLCERPVHKITQTRNYQRPGLNITFWHHPAHERCFVVDDLYERQPPIGSTPYPFEVNSVREGGA